MERYPDLEIYAKDITFKQVEDWLKTRFESVERTQVVTKKSEARLHLTVDDMEVLIFGNAIGKYSSLWFKQNQTPWNNDLDLAHEAAKELATQVRCSNSGWQEGQGPESQWWRVVDGEEDMLIEWPDS